MPIRPARLPHVRDQMVRLLSDPNSALRRHGSVESEHGFSLDIAARHLTVGGLYWVASDMGALATSAAHAAGNDVSEEFSTRLNRRGNLRWRAICPGSSSNPDADQ